MPSPAIKELVQRLSDEQLREILTQILRSHDTIRKEFLDLEAALDNRDDLFYHSHRLPYCRLRKTSSEVTVTAVLKTVTGFTVIEDTDFMYDATNENDRIRFKTAGMYCYYGAGLWASNSTGGRQMRIDLNGATIIDNDRRQTAATAGGVTNRVISAREFKVDDYIQLKIHQDSGGGLDMLASDENSILFGAFMIDPLINTGDRLRTRRRERTGL